MGICSSCLGRDRSSSHEDENSRLLFDDPHAVNYSSFGDQVAASQADPQDVQREAEALQKIVAQTSNHLVDIFAMVPQSLQRSPATTFSGQDTRLLQYQDVLARLPADAVSDANEDLSAHSVQGAIDWPSDEEEDDDEDLKRLKIVKPPQIGPLLGGFAEIEK